MSYAMKLRLKGFKLLDNSADCCDEVASLIGSGCTCKVWSSEDCPISLKEGYEQLECTFESSKLLFGSHKVSFDPLFCDVNVFTKENELNVRIPVGYKGKYRYYRLVKI